MTLKKPFDPIYDCPPMRMKACRHGAMLYNVNDAYVGRSFDLYGEFSESEMSFLGNFVRPNQVIFDVGANIGAHTIFFAQTVGPKGRVVAMEPQRPVFQTLCANVALNGLGNVLTINAGAGEQPGMTTLELPEYNAGGNFGGFSLIGQSGNEAIQILPLDNVELSSLALIKIDVEGMELDVLKGARQTIAKHMPALYIENDRREKSPQLIEHILAMNYRAYWHMPSMFNPDNFAGNPENVFPKIISLNLLCLPARAEQKIEGLIEVKTADEFPTLG